MTSSTHRFFDLKKFEIGDRAGIDAFFDGTVIPSCEYNFVNLFCWEGVYQYSWFIHDERLVVYDGLDGIIFMPSGPHMSPEQLQKLSAKAVCMGLSGDICLVPEDYPDRFPDIIKYYEVMPDRDAAEYIYLAENLADLKGNKLHKKRNLISQFKRKFPDFRVVPVGTDNLAQIRSFSKDLLGIADPVPKTLLDEFSAMEKAFDHWDDLGLEGIIVTVDGNIAAFSIFSAMGQDTYNVHFEKSNLAFKGAAQMINRETALYLKDKTCYLNREQDLGIKGLRQAKLSYAPHRLWTPWQLKFIG